MPSTPHGIVYPASSDAPRVWADMQTMAESVEANLAQLGVTQAYTPVWTNMTLGAGAVNEGYYTALGDLVFWQFRVEFGTAPSISTTIQTVLPVPGWTGGGLSLTATVGSWTLRDTSAGEHYAGSIAMWQADGTLAAFAGAYTSVTTKSSSRIAPAIPVTIGAQDVLSGTGVYRKA